MHISQKINLRVFNKIKYNIIKYHVKKIFKDKIKKCKIDLLDWYDCITYKIIF